MTITTSADLQTSLADRVALVTGGGSGLGRALSLELATAGATVLVADIDAAGAEETVGLVERSGAPGKASAVRLDVTDRAAVDTVIEEASATYGDRFDLLVSNAGTDRGADLTEIDDDQWHGVFAVNVHGPMYLARAFVRHLQGVGAGSGDLVCVTSISALTVGAGAGAYNASKAAMRKLAEVMQTEARERGWPARVTIIDPAAMNTPMMEQWSLPDEVMMNPAVVAGLVRHAVTLPPDVVLQSAVVTKRTEQYPR